LKNKLYIAFVSFFLGLIVSYNLLLNQFEYRISFYGFKEVRGELIPIIKLRKHLKGNHKDYSVSDPGREVELPISLDKPAVVFSKENLGF
jgi:hypothetical protein